MSTYLHPDLDLLVAKLQAQGFAEVPQIADDFTRVFKRPSVGTFIVIDLPEEEVYEAIDVHFSPAPPTSLLVELGFPL
jgi:hypothetical protein